MAELDALHIVEVARESLRDPFDWARVTGEELDVIIAHLKRAEDDAKDLAWMNDRAGWSAKEMHLEADLTAAREEAKGLREEIARLPWMIGKTLPNFARIPGAIVLSSFPQIATILAALGREGGEDG